MFDKKILASRWADLVLPYFEGLLHASGDVYELRGTELYPSKNSPEIGEWINLGINAQRTLDCGQLRVICGEASEHGSIGVIVLEDIVSKMPVWSFISHHANPFEQIEIKGGKVVVLSNTGTIFRFCPSTEHPAFLFLP